MEKSIFRSDLFQDRRALITGGGTGIGLRTAKEFVSLGGHAILAGRREELLQKAAADLGNASYVVLNIREEESVKNCFSQLVDQGGVDFLVNNAGGQFPSLADQMSLKGWRAVIETNLTGTFMMCQEAFNTCFKDKGGKIVNVIANIWNGFPLLSHTGAARAGVDNLTKSLAVEWGPHGVSINSVAPGVIDSSGLDTYDEHYQKVVRSMAKNNQSGRLGTEGEVASAILFFLSPAAQYITGTTLRVDGGEPLYHPFHPPRLHDKLPPELV